MKRTVFIPLVSILWTLTQTPVLATTPTAVATADNVTLTATATDTTAVVTADTAPLETSAAAPAETKPMSLDECMRYAVEHSPAVRRQDYTNQNYRQDYIESIAALVPSVSGSVGASTSFGRSVDPETNTYTDVSNFDNSYSVSGQMPVFAGLTGINTIRAARVMRMQGVEELQLARDQIALETMQAYFDVVYYTESVRLAREQLETSTAELAKSRKMFELGLKSAADVAEVESQQASDDYLVTQQENNLALAQISLAETMNYPADQPLQIETDIDIEVPAGVAPFGEVLDYALENNPKAVAAQHSVRYSRLKFSVARILRICIWLTSPAVPMRGSCSPARGWERR